MVHKQQDLGRLVRYLGMLENYAGEFLDQANTYFQNLPIRTSAEILPKDLGTP